jgi:hypothetical protein
VGVLSIEGERPPVFRYWKLRSNKVKKEARGLQVSDNPRKLKIARETVLRTLEMSEKDSDLTNPNVLLGFNNYG